MRTIPYYPNFECELVRRGISDSDIAKALDITPRTLKNKRNGIRPFTWPEVNSIQKIFFPDVSKDYLFALNDPTRTA